MAPVSPARRLLPVLAAALSLATPAAAQAPLEGRLVRALTVPHIALSRSGAEAVDLETGEIIFAHEADAPLVPASNEKLPVTFAALSLLGPLWRLETDVLGEGRQRGPVWEGDVVLRGYGDPTLSSSDLDVLARKLRAAGIRRITGDVLGDESWFDKRRTAPGWKASYFINESPPLSALVVDRARYGHAVSHLPALAAALQFRTALSEAGIRVAGSVHLGLADENAVPLGRVQSAPLWSIVRRMDLKSDNFTAEMLLKELGAVQQNSGTSSAGAAVVRRLLGEVGVPLAGVRIVDGSGLSRLDRLTANALVTLLQKMWADPKLRPALLRALPVAGVSGTLEERMRRGPARGRVLAKTGTTSTASALSGFVRGRYAFAVIQNGSPLSYWWARVAQDRFATTLAS
jgi:D-alanyl-D-alanine carboxypeptidase/D-alanyl-D-alanine-endopeptidase (penicillin-binding protein 4)